MNPVDEIRERARSAAGGDEFDRMERRLGPLEEAVAENVRLAKPLADLVADLERAVSGIVERSSGRVKP